MHISSLGTPTFSRKRSPRNKLFRFRRNPRVRLDKSRFSSVPSSPKPPNFDSVTQTINEDGRYLYFLVQSMPMLMAMDLAQIRNGIKTNPLKPLPLDYTHGITELGKALITVAKRVTNDEFRITRILRMIFLRTSPWFDQYQVPQEQLFMEISNLLNEAATLLLLRGNIPDDFQEDVENVKAKTRRVLLKCKYGIEMPNMDFLPTMDEKISRSPFSDFFPLLIHLMVGKQFLRQKRMEEFPDQSEQLRIQKDHHKIDFLFQMHEENPQFLSYFLGETVLDFLQFKLCYDLANILQLEHPRDEIADLKKTAKIIRERILPPLLGLLPLDDLELDKKEE